MVSAFLVYACCVSFMLHGMRWRSLRRFLRIADFDGSQKRHMRPPAVAMMHARIIFHVMNGAHAACPQHAMLYTRAERT